MARENNIGVSRDTDFVTPLSSTNIELSLLLELELELGHLNLLLTI